MKAQIVSDSLLAKAEQTQNEFKDEISIEGNTKKDANDSLQNWRQKGLAEEIL